MNNTNLQLSIALIDLGRVHANYAFGLIILKLTLNKRDGPFFCV